MKELSIEEKARAYDEAIERANDILKGYDPKEDSKATINYIFPELNKSEDERIREALIDYFNKYKKQVYTFYRIPTDNILAWLEKQGKKEFTFKSIPRLLEMIEPTDRAKSYCQKLIDSLVKEGYITDAKIVKEVLKGWNGKDVPMAVMDEQKPYGQREECLDCQFNYAGECKGFCAMKRNEQKPADKAEPKFKNGQWIVFNGLTLYVNEVVQGYYRTTSIGGIPNSYDWNIDNAARLWSIEDAKDGDVLIDKSHVGECVFIFKEARPSDIKTEVNNPLAIIGYCGINHIGFTSQLSGLGFGDTANCTYYPATKEQRDLLFRKMHEAGYTFDFKKKELKKLKFKVGDEIITENEESLTITRIDEEGYWSNDLFICNFDEECIWDLVEQKPYGQRKECLDCQFNYAGECKGSCAMKRSEQNHIDYVKTENCDISSGYGIKENGSSYPTKPAVFSEQKPKPKFKIGDWVIWNNKVICYIDNVYQGKEVLMYTMTDTNNINRSHSIKSFDNNAHLWTIKDAKPGDVLREDSCTFIIQELYNNNTLAKTYCTLYDDGDFDDGSTLSFDVDSTHPATKEQRDTFFAKMREAGYEWDANNKEVKLLITNGDFKSKEVDLEKEISDYLTSYHLHIKDGGRVVFDNDDSPNFMCDIRHIAKHFFELGQLNARKEE